MTTRVLIIIQLLCIILNIPNLPFLSDFVVCDEGHVLKNDASVLGSVTI